MGLPQVDIDPVRMHQVLSNLVDNAIRAMAEGGSIRLSARVTSGADARPPDPAGRRLLVEVTDNGPGIPNEIRGSVFERFTKSASSRGSGLGLAIARAIVEAHGGSISAAAGPGGRGTAIRVSLPV